MVAINSTIAENFQAFYYEILRQKEKALRLSIPSEIFEDPSAPVTVEAIQTKLRSTLQEQLVKMEYAVGLGNTAVFRDAQYLMVSLADEIFLTLQWGGARIWESQLLEAQIFQTQIAGEYVFKKLDLLLESSEPSREDLAYLYFMVLSLGFRGKYRGMDEEGKIQWYLNHLYKIIQGRFPKLTQSDKALLIKECYDFTLTEPAGKGLPDNRTWAIIIGGVVIIYVLITYVVWYRLAAEMHTALNHIFSQIRNNPLL